MKLTEKIRTQIKKLPEGKPFGYADLGISKEDYVSSAKVIERLQKQGAIRKLSKGVFYKPEKTAFGELKPDYNEQLRPYLFENGKRIAYITGTHLYNQLNLTTQKAFIVKIASRSKRIKIAKGAIRADAVKSYAEVTDNNYELLGFLDAIKDIKKIPDSNVVNMIKTMTDKIMALNEKKKSELVKYALFYPPRVRALLGAILENRNVQEIITGKLKESLNPLTKVKIGLKESDLPTIKQWNIK